MNDSKVVKSRYQLKNTRIRLKEVGLFFYQKPFIC